VEHDPGNKNVRVTREDVSAAAREVGVEPGDTLFFHSSLKSMGQVVGGPDTVIDGFLDVVGRQGTVAVPTLCNWAPGEQGLVLERWDPATSPSYVGAITEALRLRPGAVRSDQATHSVAAIGARAEELTARHGASGLRRSPFTAQAFAHESPWQRLVDWNAAYCFIGVTFRVCTMVHFVEANLAERALERIGDGREEMHAELESWMKPGPFPGIRIEDREVIEEMLAAEGIVRYSSIGSATFRCARARPMVERWIAIVEGDPGRWLPEEYLALVERYS
jgi:aminoglycoside 3-N-acetyltransferase